jgi:hypothetical protein
MPMGRKSREKRERRAAAAAAPPAPVVPTSPPGIEAGQGFVLEGPGLGAGLSNGRPYALVERPELLDNRDPPRPTWRRVWLRP